MSGPDRDRRLAELASGSSQWQEMFASLARAHDEIVQEKEAVEAAKKAGDRTALSRHEEAQARAEIKYEDQEKKLAAMNLTPGDLQAIFDLPDAAQKPRVDELKATFIGFPARLTAIDTYAAAYDNFRAKYKGVVDDVDEVKSPAAGFRRARISHRRNRSAVRRTAGDDRATQVRRPCSQSGGHHAMVCD